jgi:hypothetical protein
MDLRMLPELSFLPGMSLSAIVAFRSQIVVNPARDQLQP